MYAGEPYVVIVHILERDRVSESDEMGTVSATFGEADGWGIGTHHARSYNSIDNKLGDFDLAYEIRRAPLPDLRAVSIRVVDEAGGTEDIVCLTVQNAGERDASPFQMTFRVGDAVPRNGTVDLGALGAGQSREACIRTDLPASGGLGLSLVVDEPGAVTEMDETNNRATGGLIRIPPGQIAPDFVSTDAGPPGPPGATPTPTPLPARADLTVGAIRVRGKEPSGADDCDPGRNDVTVVVRNQGTAAASNFAVRVTVDDEDDDAEEASGLDLDAGKDLAVLFDDVKLKKGNHKLTATADPRNAVAESREDNNKLDVSVRCKDEGD